MVHFIKRFIMESPEVLKKMLQKVDRNCEIIPELPDLSYFELYRSNFAWFAIYS